MKKMPKSGTIVPPVRQEHIEAPCAERGLQILELESDP